MAIFKCKMCGGTLEISEKQTVAECEYCGTQQTLPRLNDERKANLYDRANHFRRNNEFDKAMSIYESILSEDGTDAEAYWSLVLCRYGIEYVEDPATHKRVPTVNRAQFTSIFDDDNYKSALENADISQRAIYEAEARAINEIQKGILAISQKEEPFDVFICYKETDNNGRRTPDSVLANDLYHQLAQEGFKVFFSRITLEDKLGTAYEPYIFAALNSAKVMVVLGTRPDYFKAVWVKNEWSRYLSLVKQSGGKKVLIPAYKDMDPYDLPEEFSHLQAQDMGKLGFMQDLIRGIKKLTQVEAPKVTVQETVIASGTNVAPLLRRAFMYLEDGEWQTADEYCEKVLDQDPENALAYLGKLMAELHVRKQDALRDQAEPFDSHNNYQKALRFADDKLKGALTGYIEHINTRNENTRLDGIYVQAKESMADDNTEKEYLEIAEIFESIIGYQDSADLANECREKAENTRKDAIWEDAKAKMDNNDISSYEKAIELFASIPGWKDADEQIVACKKEIEIIKADAEAYRQETKRRAKRNKKIAMIAIPIVCAVIAIVIILNTVIIPNGKYNDAIALMDSGKIIEAYEALIALGEYKDSAEKADSIYEDYLQEKITGLRVGDSIFFGTYEQDNNTINGNERIEWIVLEIREGNAFLVSRYALDSRPYNSNREDVTWENCSVRAWLNDVFLSSAFSHAEIARILAVNPDSGTSLGPTVVQDRVFLMSLAEVNQFFNTTLARLCRATAYAEAQGAYISDSGNCEWWLRSLGDYQGKVVTIESGGGINEYGHSASEDMYAIRPVMWIDISKVTS